jgi:hypothetical protein
MVWSKAGFLLVLQPREICRVPQEEDEYCQFYEDCSAAWQELLESRINASPVTVAKTLAASPGQTGIKQPRGEDIDD